MSSPSLPPRCSFPLAAAALFSATFAFPLSIAAKTAKPNLVDFFDSNGELRGRKRDLYEGGVRVPLIVRWPGRVPAGTTSDHLSGFQDFMPTFAELAGIKAPPGDGLSLVSTLL